MDNNIIDKRTKGNWFYLPPTDKGKQIPILTDCADETIVCFIGIKGQPNEANAAFIVKACNEYDKLKEQNLLLLEALKDVMLWGKTKNGTFTYVTSEDRANEIKEAINKCSELPSPI